jgi:hypothetical protein
LYFNWRGFHIPFSITGRVRREKKKSANKANEHQIMGGQAQEFTETGSNCISMLAGIRIEMA